MKNSFFLSIILIFILSGCISSENNQPKPIIIGSILPLTGDLSVYGQGLIKGMELAVTEINQDTGSQKLKIIFEDDRGIPNVGISAFNKLQSIDKVNYIIGGVFSNVALSIAPIAEKENIILMSPTASSVELTKNRPHVFRIYPSDSYDGQYLANFTINKLNKNSVAILSANASSTEQISRIYAETLDSLGGTISFRNSYSPGETNFKPVLQRLRSIDSEVIFLPGYLEDIATILKQSKELGLNKTYLTISTIYDEKFLDITDGASDGVIFSAPEYDSNSSDPVINDFVEKYSGMYDSKPDILAAYGYDVVKLSYLAISTSKEDDVTSIIKNLHSISNFQGVTGSFSFTENGDVIKSLKMLIINDGEFKEY